MIVNHRPHPPWGATKKQSVMYQRERDRKNRIFALQQAQPPNDRTLAVTQELVALFYAEDRSALVPWPSDAIFDAGLRGDDPPADDNERWQWEAGALAAHLIEIGGQR